MGLPLCGDGTVGERDAGLEQARPGGHLLHSLPAPSSCCCSSSPVSPTGSVATEPMRKYFLTLSILKGPWDQVFTAFWQRYPNPYRKHVLTEDILHREVTDDQKLLSRSLLTKTNWMPHRAEHLFPPNVGRHVYSLEDSIVDLQNRTMTTFTWNINHARLMVVEERCVYRENPENSSWAEVKREAWVSSRVFGYPGIWLG